MLWDETDYTRVNEFDQCEEPTEEMLAKREQEMATTDNAAEDAAVPSPTIYSSGAIHKCYTSE